MLFCRDKSFFCTLCMQDLGNILSTDKLFPDLSVLVCKKQRLFSTALDTVIYPCQKVFFFRFNEFVAPESMKATDGV